MWKAAGLVEWQEDVSWLAARTFHHEACSPAAATQGCGEDYAAAEMLQVAAVAPHP